MWAFLFLTDWAYTHAQYQYYLPTWTTGVMQNDTDTTSNMAFSFAMCNLEKFRKPDRLPKTVERNSQVTHNLSKVHKTNRGSNHTGLWTRFTFLGMVCSCSLLQSLNTKLYWTDGLHKVGLTPAGTWTLSSFSYIQMLSNIQLSDLHKQGMHIETHCTWRGIWCPAMTLECDRRSLARP